MDISDDKVVPITIAAQAAANSLRRRDDPQQGGLGRPGAGEESSRVDRRPLQPSAHCGDQLLRRAAGILLSVGRFDPARADLNIRASEHAGCADATCHDEHHGHNYSTTFSTWSYETNRPLSLEGLRETARKLPGNIYRAKGVAHTSDAPDRRAVLRSSASVLTSRWKMSGATGRRAHRSWSSARVARWMARACGRNSPVAQRRS